MTLRLCAACTVLFSLACGGAELEPVPEAPVAVSAPAASSAPREEPAAVTPAAPVAAKPKPKDCYTPWTRCKSVCTDRANACTSDCGSVTDACAEGCSSKQASCESACDNTKYACEG